MKRQKLIRFVDIDTSMRELLTVTLGKLTSRARDLPNLPTIQEGLNRG